MGPTAGAGEGAAGEAGQNFDARRTWTLAATAAVIGGGFPDRADTCSKQIAPKINSSIFIPPSQSTLV
jgi:hypothetical protein